MQPFRNPFIVLATITASASFASAQNLSAKRLNSYDLVAVTEVSANLFGVEDYDSDSDYADTNAASTSELDWTYNGVTAVGASAAQNNCATTIGNTSLNPQVTSESSGIATIGGDPTDPVRISWTAYTSGRTTFEIQPSATDQSVTHGILTGTISVGGNGSSPGSADFSAEVGSFEVSGDSYGNVYISYQGYVVDSYTGGGLGFTLVTTEVVQVGSVQPLSADSGNGCTLHGGDSNSWDTSTSASFEVEEIEDGGTGSNIVPEIGLYDPDTDTYEKLWEQPQG